MGVNHDNHSLLQEKFPMSVKPDQLKRCKQDSAKSVQFDFQEIDVTGMSLMSLIQMGGALLLKHAIAGEISDHLKRPYYQHGENFAGHRNGYQATTIDTPNGPVVYDRPKVANAKGFKSKFHTPNMHRPDEFAKSITDMYVNGVSTRKVKDSLRAVSGEKVRLSKSTVSRVTKQLRDEFKVWKTRSLADLKIAYLFLDAIHIGMRVGGKKKDAVFVAYGIMEDGTLELLALDIGIAEANRTWGKFVSGLKSRGLRDPLLVCSDGNPALIRSIESNFPTSYRQRCLKHRMDNILDTVPSEDQDKVYKQLKLIFYESTSLEQAKSFMKQFRKDFGKKYPTTIERLTEDLDQCLTYFLFPPLHWKRIRTSNKLERLNKELRRRLDVIGRHPYEHGCLSLIYGVAIKYADQQRGFSVDEITQQLWLKLRESKVAMLEQLLLDEAA